MFTIALEEKLNLGRAANKTVAKGETWEYKQKIKGERRMRRNKGIDVIIICSRLG